MLIRKVCVFCASSDLSDSIYLDAAKELGEILAQKSIHIVYGGGSSGSMGMLANGALSKGGKVTGIIPKFMDDLEWGHDSLTELRFVETMNERKEQMILNTDAAIALPGGSGTFEELFDTITLKRLGFYLSPIVFINIKGFFNPCLELLEKAIEEKFMDPRSRDMWTVINNPSEIIEAITSAPKWSKDAVKFASLKKGLSKKMNN